MKVDLCTKGAWDPLWSSYKTLGRSRPLLQHQLLGTSGRVNSPGNGTNPTKLTPVPVVLMRPERDLVTGGDSFLHRYFIWFK